MLTPYVEHPQTVPSPRDLRTVVVVGQPGQTLPDSTLDAVDYDVVVLEPVAHAYSQIKRMRPSLVVMCLAFDDAQGWQLPAMLQLDRETASIPVRTYAMWESPARAETDPNADEADALARLNLAMN